MDDFETLTSEQQLENILGRIRFYADNKNLTAKQVAAIFEAGMSAEANLRPAFPLANLAT